MTTFETPDLISLFGFVDSSIYKLGPKFWLRQTEFLGTETGNYGVLKVLCTRGRVYVCICVWFSRYHFHVISFITKVQIRRPYRFFDETPPVTSYLELPFHLKNVFPSRPTSTVRFTNHIHFFYPFYFHWVNLFGSFQTLLWRGVYIKTDSVLYDFC